MTSTDVPALARELNFHRAAAPDAAGVDARFRFVLDFDSPVDWPDLPYDPGAPDTHHGATARTALDATLRQAARVLAARAPAAFGFVDAQLERTLLRQSPRVAGASSASHRARIGLCLFTNLHGQADAVSIAVEGLLHEAIHQHLYRRERADGHFCDLAETPTFRSPWTGARLPLHSLVHASFVWFGLLTLWSRLALTPASAADATHARERIAHCLAGFAFLDDLFASPAFPRAAVDATVLDALRGLARAAAGASLAAGAGGTLRAALARRETGEWAAALASALEPAAA